MLIVRKMTPELGTSGIGILTASMSMTTILLVATNFGLGSLLTRELTKSSILTLPFLWSVLRLRWILGAACYGILLLYVNLLGFESAERIVWLLSGLALFIESTSMACDSVLQAHNRFEYQSFGQIVSAIVYFILAWMFLANGHGLLGVVWANLASRVARLLVMVPLMLLKTGPWTWKKPDNAPSLSLRWMMALGFPLFLSSTFGTIYNQIDTIMLKDIVGAHAAGIYGLGHKVYDVAILMPHVFATALFPIMTRYSIGNISDASRLGERALRFMQIAIFPLTVLLTFTAGLIISELDPDNLFAESKTIFIIVIWALPLFAAQAVFNRLIITAKKERAFIRIGLTSMVINIVLNSILIPRFSYYGASIATIVSVTVSFLMHIQTLNNAKLRPPLVKALVGPIAATAIAWCLTVTCIKLAAPSWNISWLGLPLEAGLLATLVSLVCLLVWYFGALCCLKVINRSDLGLLEDLFN